jgi:hypothetical protein
MKKLGMSAVAIVALATFTMTGAAGASTAHATGLLSGQSRHQVLAVPGMTIAGKVKVGQMWTLTVVNCEVQTFAAGHTWTADLGSDAGTYKGGGKKITEAFTAGIDEGGTFKGKFAKSVGGYSGTYTFDGSNYSATLVKGATSGC